MSSKYDIVKLHMDTMGFASKPDKDGDGKVGKVVTRTSHNTVTLTKEKFVEAVGTGHSFIPGLCDNSEIKSWEGVKQKNWLQQDLFFLDFDNEDVKNKKGEVIKQIEYISLDDAVQKLEGLGIKVFVAYRTFSSGKVVDGREIEKFRLGIAATETIVDREIRDKFQAIIMGIMNAHIDKSCKNRNRYFNGTTYDEIVYVNYEAEVDVQWAIDTYWNISYERFLPGSAKYSRPDKEMNAGNVVPYEEFKERQKKVYEVTPVEEFPDVFPRVHDGLIKYDMQGHLEEYLSLVENALEENSYEEGTGRRSVIFDVFNMVSFSYGTREAYLRCLEINEQFEVPLTAKEFNDCTWNALYHVEENCHFMHETQFVYRYDTLLERLQVSDAKKKGLNYFKNKEEKEHANKWRPLKKERDAFVVELRNAGMGAKRIRKALVERYGEDSELALTVDGVKYFLKHRMQKGVSFGTIVNNTNLTHTCLEESSPICDEPQANEEPTLNEEQQKVLEDALRGSNLVISGFAGTGKSYLIQQIREALESRGQAVAVCAATGVAAYNVGGSTLHRLFHIYGEEEWDRTITNDLLYEIADYKTIVVDEAGMVKAKDFQHMCEVLTKVKRKLHKNIQLILVCDVLQLPPVNDAFFFQTSGYHILGFKHHYLTKSIRQQGDVEYSYYLNKVRIGEDKELTSCELNRICNRCADNRYTYIVPYKADTDRINKQHLSTLEGELIDLGNEQFVKVGAKVIVTENYSRNGITKYFNGMQGKVTSVSDNKNIVTILTTDGRIVKIHRRQVQVDGRWVCGFPISLGYAITTHKSQGMTLEGANINPCAFAEGQLYVALSRVKSARGVHLLKPIRPEYIKVNGDALAFDEMMREESERSSFVMAM